VKFEIKYRKQRISNDAQMGVSPKTDQSIRAARNR